MKGICTVFFMLSGFFTFAQLETVPHQFWNNFSHFNPAYAGLQYQGQAGVMYEGFRKNNSQHDYQVFYNQRLKKNFGIGLNGNHRTGFNDQTSEVSVPISYDWNVKGKHHLAFGIAPSYRNFVSSGLVYDTTSAGTIYVTGADTPWTRNYLQTHVGITYRRGHLFAGLGMRNIHLSSWGSPEIGPWSPHYYGHLSVDIPVGSKSQWNTPHTMTLSGLYTYVNGFNRIDMNMRLQLESGLNVLVGGRFRGGWTVGAGWDVFEKCRCLYSVSWQRSKLSNSNNVSHELSVVYHLDFAD